MTRKIKLGWGSKTAKRTKPFKRRKVIRTDGDYKFIDVRFTLQPSNKDCIISRGKSPVKSDDYPYGLDEHSPEFFRGRHKMNTIAKMSEYNRRSLIKEFFDLSKFSNIVKTIRYRSGGIRKYFTTGQILVLRTAHHAEGAVWICVYEDMPEAPWSEEMIKRCIGASYTTNSFSYSGGFFSKGKKIIRIKPNDDGPWWDKIISLCQLHLPTLRSARDEDTLKARIRDEERKLKAKIKAESTREEELFLAKRTFLS